MFDYSPQLSSWLQLSYMNRLLSVPIYSPEFVKSISNYPKIELEHDKEFLKNSGCMLGELPNDDKIKFQRVLCRWQNPICRYCSRKDNNPTTQIKYIICPHCCLEFYCSQECFVGDQKRHHEMCKTCPHCISREINSPHEITIVNRDGTIYKK